MTKSERSLNLIRNALQTPDGTVLESRGRHDFVSYTDKNGKTYMVDGGLAYVRRSNNGDEFDMCLYDNEPHEIQRVVLKWGSYGKHGDQPLRLIPIAEMETGHIAAVLTECSPAYVYRQSMVKEMEQREND